MSSEGIAMPKNADRQPTWTELLFQLSLFAFVGGLGLWRFFEKGGLHELLTPTLSLIAVIVVGYMIRQKTRPIAPAVSQPQTEE
jgi:hypothetical protein